MTPVGRDIAQPMDSSRVAPDHLLSGDVLLFRGRSTLGKLIRLFDGTDVSHAGLFHDGFVLEALGKGLEKRPLATSMQGNEWVMARRLRNFSGSMEPVSGSASRMLAEGHRYAYEQLLLLALLCTARKVPVTPVLGRLLRAILDKAADFLADLAAGGKEPMICSEYVFRCYDEALPGDDDEFSLEIDTARRSLMEAAHRGLGTAREARGRGIEAGSLLSLAPIWSPVSATPGNGRRGALAEGVTDDVEVLGETYLHQVGQTGARGRGIAAPIDESGDSLIHFAIELTRAIEAPRRPPGVAPVDVTERQALATLARVAANFVTPGDLLRSPSLEIVGIIEA